MAKSKKSSKKDEKEREKKAAAKARAKAAAKAAALVGEAKKARKAADKAARTADKAEAKATAAGAPAPKAKPDEAELLRLALRSTEAQLTDAERRIEVLQGQIADLHTVLDDAAEEALEDAIVDAAVTATVQEAVLEAEVAADGAPIDAVEIEAVAIELEEIAVEATPAPEEPSHEGEAAAAAEVLAASDAGEDGPRRAGSGASRSDVTAEPEGTTVTATELTPPLPEEPADDTPNTSWTLLRLRQEAKSRGLTGTSNLPKAALLARLTRTYG